jgi:hypothetical protein
MFLNYTVSMLYLNSPYLLAHPRIMVMLPLFGRKSIVCDTWMYCVKVCIRYCVLHVLNLTVL